MSSTYMIYALPIVASHVQRLSVYADISEDVNNALLNLNFCSDSCVPDMSYQNHSREISVRKYIILTIIYTECWCKFLIFCIMYIRKHYNNSIKHQLPFSNSYFVEKFSNLFANNALISFIKEISELMGVLSRRILRKNSR